MKVYVSEQLGFAPEKIVVREGDSAAIPIGSGTGGSKSTLVNSVAIMRAVDIVIAKARIAAARMEHVRREALGFERGLFFVAGSRRTVRVADIAARYPGVLDSEGQAELKHGSSANGCHACEVEIDPDTGAVAIIRYTAVDDFGHVIDAADVRGQVQGGVAMGLGQALVEIAPTPEALRHPLATSPFGHALLRAEHIPVVDWVDNGMASATNVFGAKACGGIRSQRGAAGRHERDRRRAARLSPRARPSDASAAGGCLGGRRARGSSLVTPARCGGGIAEGAAGEPLAPGWRIRLRLLSQDLLRFDRRRLGWALAARTVAGLALPMLLARAFDTPGLVYLGIGAYLIAIGDSVDDGDRDQPVRIVAGALLGAVALAAGVLLGGGLAAAVAGMLVFGLLAGMMGVYGDAFAAMGLPVVWAYVELGAPATDHSAANALWLGAMFALGGALTLALTLGLRPATRARPEQVRAADCFREVALYLAGRIVAGPVSAETVVRSTIASARQLASEARGGAEGANRHHQQTVVLIEIADRLFSLAGALREAGLNPPPLAAEALDALQRNLEGRGDSSELRRLASELADPSASETSAARFDPGGLARRMAEELTRALRIAANEGGAPPPFAAPTSERRLAALWSPLLDNLNPNSTVARHALRYALALAAAVVVFWLFPKPFGYWTPLTVTVVLKPFAGMTLERAVQRTIGTVIGILAGIALMRLLPTIPLQSVATMALFFMMMAVLPFNYSLAIVFLSAGLIPFEHILDPLPFTRPSALIALSPPPSARRSLWRPGICCGRHSIGAACRSAFARRRRPWPTMPTLCSPPPRGAATLPPQRRPAVALALPSQIFMLPCSGR